MTAIIALESDFRDYYDHWFAGSWQKPGIVFNRSTTGGLLRPAMFQYLEALGLTLPKHGLVKHLYPKLLSRIPLEDPSLIVECTKNLLDVVVYTDTQAHAGEGKLLVNLHDALQHYPNHFASEHIPALPNGLGQSLRYLCIGSRQFWLRYTSADDWRSNCGEVNIEVLCEEQPHTVASLQRNKIQYPLFAVDFVCGRELYAVDFNIAPGIKGTGIEDQLPAQEAYLEIANWISRHNNS